ncbi:hypothetical protein [Microvirga solisilvae]|uniref:hypothetical protein n=1 Tax=Microvirga solisilvae TaxID=2919498 RepID=UPI001FB02A3F|nr:hypothetical protein [Microvirga solisilvae]
MAEPATTIMGVKAASLVSSATGGAVAVIRTRGPWWLRLASGFSGAAVSYYLTPPLTPVAIRVMEWATAHFLNAAIVLDEASVMAALGFFIGTTGLELPQLLVNLIGGKRALPQIKPPSQPGA